MRHKRRAAVLATAALLASPVVANAATTSVPTPKPAAAPQLQSWLASHLTEVSPQTQLRVAVRAGSAAQAAAAADAVGMRVQQRWPLLDAVVAVGRASVVRGLLQQPGVLTVEGDRPMSTHLQTSHAATRSDQALDAYPAFDGTGVTIAVIDSGIDGTHPFFTQDGESKVVQNRKNACGITFFPATNDACFQQVPTNDTDTISVGGHGTHVAGIAAGVPVTTTAPAGTQLRGSAPGAKLVGLSVGAAIGLLDSVAAQNWVLEHMQNPCRSAAEQSTTGEVDAACPPIRVTNHSYGPIATEGEDQEFVEDSTAVVAQREFVKRGGVTVWAAGNDGGDGSFAATNPTAMDPTPGVLMVASYNDGQSGDRDNALSGFSSRGKKDALGTYPDLSAPGDLITSACRTTLAVCQGSPSFDGGDYQTISGTSMASPYVAGVVAALMSADPSLTPARIEDVLEDTAHKFTAGAPYEADPRNGDDTTSYDKGHGLVDVAEAFAVLTGTPAPTAPVLSSCTPSSFQVLDAEGDASQVVLVDTPLPSSPSLDVRKAWMTWDAAAQAMTFHITVTDLAAGPPVGSAGEYLRFYFTRGADPEAYVVASKRATNPFTLRQFDSGASTPVTGTFDLATDTVRVVVPAAAYGLVIPGSTIADADKITVGQVLGQRDTGAATLTTDTAVGSCPFVVGTSTPGVEAAPSDPGTGPGADCTRPNGKPCKEPKDKGGKGGKG